LASAGISVRPRSGGGALDRLAAALRALPRPVIGRIEDGRLVLDLRCLRDDEAFIAGLAALDVAPPP